MGGGRKEGNEPRRKWEKPALTVLAFRDTQASFHKRAVSQENQFVSGDFGFS